MSKIEELTNEASAMRKDISSIAEQGGRTPLGELIQKHCPDQPAGRLVDRYEEYDSEQTAVIGEKKIKSGSGREKLKKYLASTVKLNVYE